MVVVSLRSQGKAEKQMYHRILIWTASFIFSGLIAGKTSFASAVISSEGTTTSVSPPSESGQERRALEQLAVRLAAGGGAWRSSRDSKPDGDETKHPLDPTIPDMNCNIDDIANYVSCYGSSVRQKAEAERRFTGLINELQAVLPPERWAGGEIEPRIGSIRSYTWRDQISDAGIDIDIVSQWSTDEEISYVVTIFGWNRDLTPTLIIQSLFRSVTLTFRRSLISRHVAALPKYLLVTAGTEIHPVSGSYGRMLRLVRTLRYQLSGCKERR